MQRPVVALVLAVLAAVACVPATAQVSSGCSTALDLLSSAPGFTLLGAAVTQVPDLVAVLSDPSLNGTILAPTDDGIQQFLNFTGISAGDLLADPDLSAILAYHLLPDVDLEDATSFQSVAYLNLTDVASTNMTLANLSALVGLGYETAEGGTVYLVSVDEDSLAAYFDIPKDSVVAVSGINAAVLDFTNVVPFCGGNIIPINSILIPEDVADDTIGSAYSSSSDYSGADYTGAGFQASA